MGHIFVVVTLDTLPGLSFVCRDTGNFLYLNTPMCYGCWTEQMKAPVYPHETKYTEEEGFGTDGSCGK